MAWPTRQYSKKQIRQAGETLCSHNATYAEIMSALEVLSNWRACHGYPLNTFQMTLRIKLKKIDRTGIAAQRLKRLPSIISKLERFDKMDLSRMQDIGGIRAIVSTIDQLNELCSNYEKTSFQHTLKSKYDYVEEPKDSGYRGIHLIYKYKNSKKPEYDGIQIELQIRTKLMHSWATAVETMGVFLNQSLKSSNGPEEWLDFFAMAGSAFAHLEGCPPLACHRHMTKLDIFKETSKKAKKLDVISKLNAFKSVVSFTNSSDARSFYLIELDLNNSQVHVTTFGRDELGEANKQYAEAEARARDGSSADVVLVSAGPIESLKKAYPNYFLDTDDFVQHLKEIRKLTSIAAKQ